MKNLKVFLLAIMSIIVLAACSGESEGFYSTNAIKGSETFKQEEDNYLVYFYSPVCQHCQAFKPTLEKYTKLDNALPVYKVNLNSPTENATWTDYEIQGTPTLIHVKKIDGVIHEVNRLIGGQELENIPTVETIYSDESVTEDVTEVEEVEEVTTETEETTTDGE